MSQDAEINEDAVRRSERLAAGYLEAELVLREYGIKQTIVVFGGTRIPRTDEALRQGKTDYYGIAREFGALVGRSGRGPKDCRLTLMTGGGPGIMEAANRGAADVGAISIGLNITLPNEQFPNPYVTRELCFDFRYFAIRKLHFLQRARALVAFPGGYGTLDELFETLNLSQTKRIIPLPIVLVGKKFWKTAINTDFLVAEGVIEAADQDLFWYAETAQEIWRGILEWNRDAGTPLLCDLDT